MATNALAFPMCPHPSQSANLVRCLLKGLMVVAKGGGGADDRECIYSGMFTHVKWCVAAAQFVRGVQ